MGDVSFRRALLGDARGIARNIFPTHDPKEVFENIELCLKDDDVALFVGELKGEMVGHVQIELMGSPRLHVARIYSFLVAERTRRKGIGTRMIGFVESWAHDEGIELLLLEVYPENNPGISFYTRHGFLRYGYLPSGSKFQNGQYSDEIMMYKWLGKG